jgi:hypothetical protein
VAALIDVVSVGLVLGAAASFAAALRALGAREDLAAVYWLVIGALVLSSAVDLFKTGSGSRS